MILSILAIIIFSQLIRLSTVQQGDFPIVSLMGMLCYFICKLLKFVLIGSSSNINETYIDGLVQDCSNSIANALELLQSCTKPSIYSPNIMDALLQQLQFLYFIRVLYSETCL